MSDIDPEVLARAKRDYGENCELVKVTEWWYQFKCGEKSFCRISRFMAEKGFGVSASEIRSRWPEMNHQERIDLAYSLQSKKTWTKNDDEVLDVIMNEVDDDIWRGCALNMLRHTSRDNVVEFLVHQVRLSESARWFYRELSNSHFCSKIQSGWLTRLRARVSRMGWRCGMLEYSGLGKRLALLVIRFRWF